MVKVRESISTPLSRTSMSNPSNSDIRPSDSNGRTATRTNNIHCTGLTESAAQRVARQLQRVVRPRAVRGRTPHRRADSPISGDARN